MRPDRLVSAWRAAGRTAEYLPDVDDIVQRVSATAKAGDIILIMSNGGFGGIHEKMLAALGGS
jgi:UDP-N-acetylmuramate: L-alanyl-gamma-D-glutamyl-meso-diaminopimelate ligase